MYRLWLLLSIVCTGCQNPPEEIAFGLTQNDVIRLTATAAEPISNIAVTEGQFVTAGTQLMQLDPFKAQEQFNLAQAQLQMAQSVLDELMRGNRKQSIAAAQAQLNAASVKAEEAHKQALRAKTLFAQRLISQSEQDRAASEWAQMQQARSAAQENVDLLHEGSRSEHIAQAKAKVASAQAQVNLQKRLLEDLAIKAPTDGFIDDLPYLVGERVNTGALLVSLSSGKQAFARLYVPQNKRASIKINDEIKLTVSGFNTPIIGKIRRIADEPAFTPFYALNQKERSRLVYLTEAEFINLKEKIPAGLTVQWVTH